MKKTLAKLLVLCLILSAFTAGIPVSAEDSATTLSAANNRYLKEDFNDGTYDSSLITMVMGGASKLSVENGALKIAHTGGDNIRYRINAKGAFADAPAGKAGKLTYDFDIKVINNTGDSNRAVVARDVSTDWSTATAFATMKTNLAFCTTTNTISTGGTATEGIWYNMKLVFDYTGDSLTYDVFVNGKAAGTDRTIANSYDPYDSGIGFATYAANDGLVYYLDNISITYVEVDELNEFYNETLVEDFDEISSLAGHGFISTSGGTTEIIEETGRGKVLHRYASETSNANIRTYFDASGLGGADRKMGKLIYEFDMKVVDNSDPKGHTVAYGFTTTDGNVSSRIDIAYNKAGTVSTTANGWRTIKLVYDYSGTNLTYDIYVNGTLYKNDVAESAYDAFHKMAFHFWGSANGRKLQYYLDDVSISYVEVIPLDAAYNGKLVENFDEIDSLDGHNFISSGGGVTEIIEEAGRGKVLHRLHPNGTYNIRTYLDASSLAGADRKLGTLTYEFDLKVVDESDGTNSVNKGDYSVSYGFHIASGDSFAGRVHARYNKVSIDGQGEVATNEDDWNKIKVVYDYSGDTLTYDVYVNGVLFRENLTESTYDAFNKMAFHFYGASNGRKLQYYIDDVSIAYVEVELPDAAYNNKLTENFDEISDLTNHSFISAGGGTTEIIEETGRGKVLHRIGPDDANHNVRTYFDASAIKKDAARKLGTVTYEFDIKVIDNSDATSDQKDRPVTFGYLTSANGIAERVHVRSGNVMLQKVSGTVNTNAADWNTVKVVYNYSGDTLTYDVYVNDALFKSSVTETEYDALDKTMLQFWGSLNGRKLEYFVDNVSIAYTEGAETFELNNLTLTKGEGTEYTLTGELCNTLGSEKTYTMILAGYDGTTLAGLDLISGKNATRGTSAVYEKFDIDAENITSFKVFVWNNLYELIPLCEAEEL